MTQFLHVQCQQFGLLVEVGFIHEVVGRSGAAIDNGALQWRGAPLATINLTARLTGNADAAISDYLILSGADDNRCVAVGVSEVINIESLNEDDFTDIPFLDFPFNDYFDKAFVRPSTQACIYRLKDITALAGSLE